MYSNLPDWILIAGSNILEKMIDACLIITKHLDLDKLEGELESRQPKPQTEYDSEGNLIISEVMGYTEDGEAIWTSPINQ